jgi:hypothetical protein
MTVQRTVSCKVHGVSLAVLDQILHTTTRPVSTLPCHQHTLAGVQTRSYLDLLFENAQLGGLSECVRDGQPDLEGGVLQDDEVCTHAHRKIVSRRRDTTRCSTWNIPPMILMGFFIRSSPMNQMKWSDSTFLGGSTPN